MKIIQSKLGCKLIDINKIYDSRGWFQVCFKQEEITNLEIDFKSVWQLNHSYTENSGIIRGLNYQESPYQQAKIVRCIRGSLYSVGVDIDKKSETFGQWCGFELSAEDDYLMYIPRTYAHGFIVKDENTELEYFTDNSYSYKHAKSIRFDDPEINIDWTCKNSVIIKNNIMSEKNKSAPFLREINT